MTARQPTAPYDVCIVGSGAGMAAYALTRAGANVVLLEAGPEWYSSREPKMLGGWEIEPAEVSGDLPSACRRRGPRG